MKQLRRLSGRRSARVAAGCYVVEGPILVDEALAAGVELLELFVDAAALGTASVDAVVDAARATGTSVAAVAGSGLAGVVDTVTPQPVAAIARRPVSSEVGPRSGLVLALIEVADPANAGTLLRSAEAAGAGAVAFVGACVDPFGPKTVRASAGSVFRVEVIEVSDPAELAGFGSPLWATVASGGEPYDRVDLASDLVLLLGNESHGLPVGLSELVHRSLSIPMTGRGESLNVAMAGTVVAFEAARQRRAAAAD